jgi:hypothetical protein
MKKKNLLNFTNDYKCLQMIGNAEPLYQLLPQEIPSIEERDAA